MEKSLDKEEMLGEICFYMDIERVEIERGRVNVIDKYNCGDLEVL